ncbi:MAG: CPBP family intramembrane metalloprotease [Chthoniobacterales bacterium]|nr:CPBP family intramembrane metalloprotease [Chthoniobacterales bacterium]
MFSCSYSVAISCIALLLLTLAFYLRLARRVSQKITPSIQPFTWLDIVATSILGAWFLFLITTSFGKDQEISLSLLLFNELIYFFLVTGILAFLALRHLQPIQLFGLAPTHPFKILGTALLWLLACYPLIMIGQVVVQTLFNTEDDTQAIVLYFLNHPGWKERLSLITMAIFVAPFAEELLFRGYLYGVARRFLGRLPAIILTSLFFAAAHLHAPSMLGLFLLAIVLCLVYERTGSLWANICIHATFNTLSIVALLFLFKEGMPNAH